MNIFKITRTVFVGIRKRLFRRNLNEKQISACFRRLFHAQERTRNLAQRQE